jgi:hypothetical protein
MLGPECLFISRLIRSLPSFPDRFKLVTLLTVPHGVRAMAEDREGPLLPGMRATAIHLRSCACWRPVMSHNYRALILGAHNQVLDKCKFPGCTDALSARGMVTSYAKANFPDHAFAELWDGSLMLAKFNRDGEEIAPGSYTENDGAE